MEENGDPVSSSDGTPYQEVEVPDEKSTRSLGAAIGRALCAGDIITLTGNLGSGKTVFAQGIARGLGVPESYDVTSPTYTLVNVYPGRIDFFHMDLYRISGPVDPADLELDDALYGRGVCVVEWPDRLPPGYLSGPCIMHLAIQIVATGDETRRIGFKVYGSGLWERIKPIIAGWRNKRT